MMHVRARKSREVGGEVHMRIKCGIHKGAPHSLPIIIHSIDEQKVRWPASS